jgi:hypothetical protein
MGVDEAWQKRAARQLNSRLGNDVARLFGGQCRGETVALDEQGACSRVTRNETLGTQQRASYRSTARQRNDLRCASETVKGPGQRSPVVVATHMLVEPASIRPCPASASSPAAATAVAGSTHRPSAPSSRPAQAISASQSAIASPSGSARSA